MIKGLRKETFFECKMQNAIKCKMQNAECKIRWEATLPNILSFAIQ